MKKLSLSFLLVFSFLFSNAQFDITAGYYTTWSGSSFSVYIIEGDYTVFKIDTSYITKEQLADTTVLKKIDERIDSYYTSYVEFCGKEPYGGDSEYGNKTSVAFASPTCGAACGMVGAKGIEVSPDMFFQIYNEAKYQINTNRIGIIGYEFGRNFFTVGGKLLFPFVPNTDDRNGGFAEGFATMGALYADIKYFSRQDPSLSYFQESLFYYQQLKRFFNAYINDPNANPYSSLAKEYLISDINRNTSNYNIPAYIAGAILVGMNEIFDQDDLFSGFIQNLDNRNNATTIEQALGNIAYCFSKSVNYNLLPFFENVLKFTIDESTASSIETLPLAPDKLIYDNSELWFLSPFDTIPLCTRSINYLNQTNYYQLYIDDSLYFETTDGNNLLDYSMLGNKESVILTIKLLDSNRNEIDFRTLNLKKRTNIDLSQYYQSLMYQEVTGYSKPEYNIATGEFKITNFSGKESYTLLGMPFPLIRNREYSLSATIRNVRANFEKDSLGNYKYETGSKVHLGGNRTSTVGREIAKEDSVSYCDLSFTSPTNIYFGEGWSENLKYVVPIFYLATEGTSTGYFKNIIYKDITDTDGDGFIDFEDHCPSVYGTENGCPKSSIVKEENINELNVYPNPNQGLVNIQFTNLIPNGLNFKLYNIHGQILIEKNLNRNSIGQSYQLNLTGLTKGIYHLIISTDSYQKSEKIVIQ